MTSVGFSKRETQDIAGSLSGWGLPGRDASRDHKGRHDDLAPGYGAWPGPDGTRRQPARPGGGWPMLQMHLGRVVVTGSEIAGCKEVRGLTTQVPLTGEEENLDEIEEICP